MKMPYIKWFYRDVQADSKLRMCSLEARGCWYEMLWIMAASDRHGYLEHKGQPYTDPMLARLIGTDIDTLYRCKEELLDAGVPSLDEKTWYNRRMVQDNQRREAGREYGKRGGGNPALRKDSEPRTQNPESRTHISINPPYKGQTAKKFVKPTPTDVATYAKSIGFVLDGESFVDFYESKGWLVGKAPMKNWKAAVRTWKKNHTGPGAMRDKLPNHFQGKTDNPMRRAF